MESWKVTATSWATSVRTLLAQLRGSGAEGDDTDAEPADACEVVQPLGLRANPTITPTLEAFAIERGDQTVATVLVDKARADGGVEPAPGETTLYAHGAQSCVVRLLAAGSVQITSASGQTVNITATGPADVIFNGGATPVAKEGSTATHTHPQGTYIAGPYAVSGISGSTPASIDVGTGSAHIKVP